MVVESPPRIARLVEWLRDKGFTVSDTKTYMITVEVSPRDLISDTNRLRNLLTKQGVQFGTSAKPTLMTNPSIAGCYCPIEEKALIMLVDLSDDLTGL